ncbi:MAG: hypothetical protein ABI613_07990 [Gemmatimonadota bacterium]
MARSTAYWSANLYQDPETPPRPGSPLRDLPPDSADRFRSLRDGLRQFEGVSERVKFILPVWKWAWEYSFLGRRLCWLHVMETGIGGTFTLSEDDARQARTIAKLSTVIENSIRNGQPTGPVLWCWVEFTHRRSVEAFLSFMIRKASWVAAAPPDSKLFRRPKAG